MPAGSIRKSLYKWAWDTRCRNIDAARVLRLSIDGETTILDAGCGEYGISAFVSAKAVVGVDIIPTDATVSGFSFVHGSIVSLPFAERSFSVAASVDVLEHLPEELRRDAITQLVNVADRIIVITFPCGAKARRIDEDFNRQLIDSNQPVPDWLTEHLEQPYPEINTVVSEIEQEAARLGRKVQMTIFYSEHLAVARSLRWLAVRSKYLYLIGNLTAGFLLPVLPRPQEGDGYRAMILAEFKND